MRTVRVGLEPVAGPDRRQDRVTVLVEVVLSDQRDHFFASEQRTGHSEGHSPASTIQNTRATDRSSLPAPVASGEMFDHVGIAVADLAASERFYRTVLSVLGAEPTHADAALVEWYDWAIDLHGWRAPRHSRPARRFRAPSREAVDAFWQAGIDAGYCDDGFLLDPDGNSAEAVHTDREDPMPDEHVDHLWIRVRDLAVSKRFYTTIAPHAGLRIGVDEPDHLQMVGENFSFSLIDDERPLTEHVHVAFTAHDDATVRAFHAAALAAGYEDNGGPGERVVHHPGYYGAFVLDPDGHNVEVVNHNR